MTSTDARRAVIAALAALSILVAPAAHADDPRGRAHFAAGRKHAKDGKWTDAAEEFEKSLAIEPSIGALLNLANAYEQLGRSASAAAKFREAEKLASAAHDDERANEARQRALALESKVARLSLRSPPNVVLEVEGVGRVKADDVIAIDPGRRTVTATAAGKQPRTIEINAAPGDRLMVVVPSLDEQLRLETRPPPTAERPTDTTTILAYVAIGTGAASAVAGGVFGVLAAGDKGDLEELCPRYPACPPASADAARNADDALSRNATIATVGLVAGAVLVAAGITMLLVLPKERSTASLLLAPGRLDVRF